MPTSIRAEGSDGVEIREISSNILADKNTTLKEQKVMGYHTGGMVVVRIYHKVKMHKKVTLV